MKIALLPGLGADRRMYGSAYDDLADEIVRVEWLPYDGEQTLDETAKKLIDHYDLGDCDAVIGSSLGGMVAAEIAVLAETKKLLLLGSAVHPREINRVLATLKGLADHVPITPFLKIFGAEVVAKRSLVLEMLADGKPDHIRGMVAAIFRWEGREEVPMERHRLHGSRDLVIMCPKDDDTVVLPRAGHMLSMTSEEETVQFLRERL